MKKDELVSFLLNNVKKSTNVEIYPDISEYSSLEIQTIFSLEDYFENVLFFYKYNNKYDREEILVITTRRFLFADKEGVERSIFFNNINRKSVFINEKDCFSIDEKGTDYFIPVSGINRTTILGLISFVDFIVKKNLESKEVHKFFMSVKGKILGPYEKDILIKLIKNRKYSYADIRIKKDHHEETWKNPEEFDFLSDFKLNDKKIIKDLKNIEEEDLILIDGINIKDANAFVRRIKMGLKIDNIFDFNVFFNLKPHQLMQVIEKIKF